MFNGSQINPKYRNRLPLPVLAARLHCTDQCISNDKINKKKNFHEKDIIIAWVAGLDIGNTTNKLLCSIQVYYIILLINKYLVKQMINIYVHNK